MLVALVVMCVLFSVLCFFIGFLMLWEAGWDYSIVTTLADTIVIFTPPPTQPPPHTHTHTNTYTYHAIMMCFSGVVHLHPFGVGHIAYVQGM